MQHGVTQVLSTSQVRQVVSMADAIDAVRTAFRDFAAGAFTLPPRQVLGGNVLVMSAHHEPTRTAIVKTISVELDRQPAIQGTVFWTGRDGQLIADARAITALRTGAIVGVATDALASPDAATLALVGAGAQAADQVRAVHTVRALKYVTVFDKDQQKAEALLADLSAELPDTEFRSATTEYDALRTAEIVCCATSSSTPVFPIDALPGRVHVNAIGSYRPHMRELPEELLATAEVLVVDELAAATVEAGEIIHALHNGSIRRSDLRELATVLQVRPATTGRTVFKTVGIAIQDWAIASLLASSTLA